jgi:ferritin-like metal-binding protein YciE
MKLRSLHDLYVSNLKDLYSAEGQIVKALPKMIKKASAPDLQDALEMHLDETREHVNRLQRIFEEMDSSPGRKKCKGMEGLIEESQEMIGELAEPEVMDAGIIAAAQKVEHYEISGYGTARAYARLLNFEQAADLLGQTLEEESRADEKLSQIAVSEVNPQATNGEHEAMPAG